MGGRENGDKGRENRNGGENGGGIVIQNENGRTESGNGGGENGGGGQLMTQIKEEDSLNIETSLLDLLLPFQLEGIKFVVRHGGRALIGDDMVSAYIRAPQLASMNRTQRRVDFLSVLFICFLSACNFFCWIGLNWSIDINISIILHR